MCVGRRKARPAEGAKVRDTPRTSAEDVPAEVEAGEDHADPAVAVEQAAAAAGMGRVPRGGARGRGRRVATRVVRGAIRRGRRG